jgi:hypothetical protein
MVMHYSPLAVATRADGTRWCTTCGDDLDPRTGRCQGAQAIDRYLTSALILALDRARNRVPSPLPTYWPKAVR